MRVREGRGLDIVRALGAGRELGRALPGMGGGPGAHDVRNDVLLAGGAREHLHRGDVPDGVVALPLRGGRGRRGRQNTPRGKVGRRLTWLRAKESTRDGGGAGHLKLLEEPGPFVRGLLDEGLPLELPAARGSWTGGRRQRKVRSGGQRVGTGREVSERKGVKGRSALGLELLHLGERLAEPGELRGAGGVERRGGGVVGDGLSPRLGCGTERAGRGI